MLIAVFIPRVASRYMLTSQWYTTECQSSADVMYAWNLTDEAIRTPPIGAKWPIGYTFQASSRPFSIECFGTLKIPLSKSCCAASIDMVRSDNWLASSTVLLSNRSDPLSVATESSRGTRYCALESVNKSRSELFGMEYAFYRANGVCITPDSVQCFEDGRLLMYPLPGCKGTPLEQSLTMDERTFTNSLVGSVRGSMTIQTKGSTQYSWTIIVPTTAYSPTFRYWNEWALLFLYITGLILVLLSNLAHLKLFLRTKTMHRAMVLFSQVCWLMFLILRLASTFGTFNRGYDGSLYLFQMIGSLLAVLQTTNFLISSFTYEKKYLYYSYGFMIFVHLGLNWNNYTRFFTVTFYTRDLVSIVTKTNLAWLIFMFVFDCIPPLYVVWKLLNSFECSWVDKIYALINTDKHFIILLLLQLFDLFLYILQDYIRTNTELLGHDRVWISMLSAEAFTQAVHCLLNSFLVEKMVKIVREKKLVSLLKPKQIVPNGDKTTKKAEPEPGTKVAETK